MIAGAHVGLQWQVWQRQQARFATAERERTHAGARQLHRHGVLRIGQQNDFRAPRTDAQTLTDQTRAGDHRLAFEHAVHCAAIDGETLFEARRLATDDVGG